MENIEVIDKLSSFYKVFGDTTRLRILNLLTEGEKNVGDIAFILSMNQSAISHQLQILRISDLVKTNKVGKTVNYSLSDDHIKVILKYGYEHILERGK
ncbi:MAG: metalloregulator ArsR/SmtB family transcription factor [Bacilli bacterium]|nr:metalloregulator ArsR/SmtB family transcription factor [Bacilli bacterium]